jgi:hypothetical protein
LGEEEGQDMRFSNWSTGSFTGFTYRDLIDRHPDVGAGGSEERSRWWTIGRRKR